MQRLKEIEQTAVKSSTWAFIHMTMSGISTFYTRTLLKKRGVELTPKSKLYYRLLVGRKKKQWLTSTFKITQQMPFTQPDLSCIFLNTDQDCGAPERIKCCLWQPLSTRVAKGHTRKVRWHQEHTLTSDGNFCRVLTVPSSQGTLDEWEYSNGGIAVIFSFAAFWRRCLPLPPKIGLDNQRETWVSWL